MNSALEKWLTTTVSDDYEVSDLGRVRRKDTGRILAIKPRANGYVSVMLSVKPKVKRRFYVHRLVAMAFLGGIPDGKQVNHKNFIRSDNRDSNLEVVTCLQNAAHSKRNGRLAAIGSNTPRGEASCRSKLTLEQIRAIRRLAASGAPKAQLGRQFGVCKQQIKNIVTGISWRDSMGESV
jgi:hypothetical protein